MFKIILNVQVHYFHIISILFVVSFPFILSHIARYAPSDKRKIYFQTEHF